MKTTRTCFLLGLVLGILIASLLVTLLNPTHWHQHQRGFSVQVDRSLDPPRLPTESSAPDYEDMWHWSFYQLTGEQTTLARFKGKVLFLHFWATWCAPCVRELAEIQALHDSLKETPIAFLLISNEREARLKTFLSGTRYQLPVYRTVEDIPDVFPILGIPGTFILDRTGRIIVQQTGPALWNQSKTIRFLLRLAQYGVDPP